MMSVPPDTNTHANYGELTENADETPRVDFDASEFGDIMNSADFDNMISGELGGDLNDADFAKLMDQGIGGGVGVGGSNGINDEVLGLNDLKNNSSGGSFDHLANMPIMEVNDKAVENLLGEIAREENIPIGIPTANSSSNQNRNEMPAPSSSSSAQQQAMLMRDTQPDPRLNSLGTEPPFVSLAETGRSDSFTMTNMTQEVDALQQLVDNAVSTNQQRQQQQQAQQLAQHQQQQQQHRQQQLAQQQHQQQQQNHLAQQQQQQQHQQQQASQPVGFNLQEEKLKLLSRLQEINQRQTNINLTQSSNGGNGNGNGNGNDNNLNNGMPEPVQYGMRNMNTMAGMNHAIGQRQQHNHDRFQEQHQNEHHYPQQQQQQGQQYHQQQNQNQNYQQLATQPVAVASAVAGGGGASAAETPLTSFLRSKKGTPAPSTANAGASMLGRNIPGAPKAASVFSGNYAGMNNLSMKNSNINNQHLGRNAGSILSSSGMNQNNTGVSNQLYGAMGQNGDPQNLVRQMSPHSLMARSESGQHIRSGVVSRYSANSNNGGNAAWGAPTASGPMKKSFTTSGILSRHASDNRLIHSGVRSGLIKNRSKNSFSRENLRSLRASSKNPSQESFNDMLPFKRRQGLGSKYKISAGSRSTPHLVMPALKSQDELDSQSGGFTSNSNAVW